MKLRSVRSDGFGPLRGQELSLAPGLTVVFGPNEAGKSSWHAALSVALCGLRRARGRGRRDDALFTSRHQPWDGGAWQLDAVVAFDDGRIVDVHWDLDQRVGRAHDARGREITSALLFDGGLDLSTAMGLDRDSFPVTAAVRQADLLALVDNAGLLQEHLQRAAATGGKDATAAAALATIERFKKDRVGLERANSTKPLQTAIVRARRAELADDDARRLHAARLEMVADRQRAERRADLITQAITILRQTGTVARLRDEACSASGVEEERNRLECSIEGLSDQLDDLAVRVEITNKAAELARALENLRQEQEVAAELHKLAGLYEDAKSKADDAAVKARLSEAAKAHRAHARAASRLLRAKELSGQRSQPAPPVEDDRQAQEAASALQAWRRRPDAVVLSGLSSQDLDALLNELPTMPDGDVDVRGAVAEAHERWADAGRRLELHEESEPDEPELSETTETEARELARALAQSSFEDRDTADLAAARTAMAERRSDPRGRLLTVLGCLLTAVGGATVIAGGPALGVAVAMAGIVALVIGRMLPPVADLDASRRSAELEGRAALAQQTSGQRSDAIRRVSALGLPADPAQLRAAADEAAASRIAGATWVGRLVTLKATVNDMAAEFVAALKAAGAAVEADPASSFAAYKADCLARHEQKEAASGLPKMQERRADRLAAEEAAADVERRRSEAEADVLAAAETFGLPASDAETAADELACCLEARPERLRVFEAARDGGRELEDLLAGGSLDDLAEEVERLDQALASQIGQDLVLPAQHEAIDALADRHGELVQLQHRLAEDAATAKATYEERRRRPADVDGAERALVLVRDEFQRLTERHPQFAPDAGLLEDHATAIARVQTLEADQRGLQDELATLQGRLEEQSRRPAVDTETIARRHADAEAELAILRADHADAIAEIDVDDLDIEDIDALADRISDLEVQLEEANKQAAELRGKLDERRRQEADVAGAEEELAEARQDLERVRRLDRTLKQTLRFLGEAQDRVHHDIAPRLAQSADRWLPVVFADRYTKIRIDPADLSVRTATADGQLREATSLSHGTAEQLYLLLRVALVEVLTEGAAETCPLLLDDLTAHFDDARTTGVLNMLQALSRERQVVLFTQETWIRDWARNALGTDDQLVELPGPSNPRPRP